MAGSAADPAFDPDDAPFSIVTGPTRDVLNDLTPKALPDYRQLKIDMLRWLDARGKNPHRRRGLSENTLEQVSMKLDQTYRWYWEEAGYFGLDFGPEDATKLMEEYSLYDYTDATLLSFKKNIKRYFRYCNWERGTDYDWECPVQLSEKQRTNRDYFRRDEFAPLYHAAMDHGSVKHPNQMSPEERDRARAYLAQRFEKPKTEIGPDDFDRANSYKIASLIGVTLDTGLRPVEVGRAKTSWVNPTDGTLDIPSSEATKSDNNWKCALSARAQRAMSNWLDERPQYEKYDDTDALWLNRRGNEYNSRTLNYLLDNLIEESAIEPAGRDLTWYSIRHGVATVWANDKGIQHAQEQLRHEKIETTMRYVHSASDNRGDMADDIW